MLLARTLWREGYDDHLAGHITSRQADGTLLVNPWGLTWDEVRASDVMRIDLDGNVLAGPWTVTPAITLHLELHKARDDKDIRAVLLTLQGPILLEGKGSWAYGQRPAFLAMAKGSKGRVGFTGG